ncbi:UNVERIFIED_CONTAM: hypothetical protein FKN15_049791 [Acipenser sinensis]
MKEGDPAVYAERAGFEKLWHPACFVCCTCNELLVDMIYFWKKGKLYCGRHYCDSEKPRCGGCDELIFSNEYTQAEDQNWHLKHFCCFDCDCVLAGEIYVMVNNKPVCKACYMKNHAAAVRYIELLPKEKQPVAGTVGAVYRKKQMAKQLPEHDQDPTKCHELSPNEVKQMQQFVKKYKEEALGVGDIKVPEEMKAQNKEKGASEAGDRGTTASCYRCQLGMKEGDPAVYAERAGFEKLWHPACFVCCTCNELLVDMIYFWKKGKLYCGRHYCDSEKPRCGGCDELIFSNEYTQAEDQNWHLKHFCCFDCDCVLAGEIYVMVNNKPVCKACYMKNHAAAVRYIELLPKEKQPVAGTVGAVYRKKQMAKQLPEHDQDPTKCHELSPNEVKQMQQFVKKYKEEALGVGDIKVPEEMKAQNKEKGASEAGDRGTTASCYRCQLCMKEGDPAVYAERAGFEKLWHPACFVCCTCNELLVDMIYFWKKGKLYCGRHYCDSEKPRCGGCDELIFSNEYTQAEDQNWHLKHFCCFDCDCVLAGEIYVMVNNKPVCKACYMKNHAALCQGCRNALEPEAQRVTYGNFNWHAEPECFLCSCCTKCLIGQKFMSIEGMLFCSVECKKKMTS